MVQECAAGLVRIKRDGGRLAFAAPPLTRFGPVDAGILRQLAAALRVSAADIVDASWLVNGPEWIGVLLPSAAQVLALNPDQAAMGELKIGVIGPHEPGAGYSPASASRLNPSRGVMFSGSRISVAKPSANKMRLNVQPRSIWPG